MTWGMNETWFGPAESSDLNKGDKDREEAV